jgi:hypothetical protein
MDGDRGEGNFDVDEDLFPAGINFCDINFFISQAINPFSLLLGGREGENRENNHLVGKIGKRGMMDSQP